MPAWAKALVKSNEQLLGEVAAMKGEKVATSRKASLEAILKDAPEKSVSVTKRTLHV